MTTRSRESERWVCLGRAIKAHGVRGELRFVPESEDAGEILRPGLSVRCECRDQSVRQLTLGERIRAIHGAYLLTIEELPEREDVQTVAGARFFVRADGVALQEEPYFFEFEGASVVDPAGTPLGSVVQVADNAGQPLLVIDRDGEERLLPLVDETFVEFVRESKRLVVRPIPGLWGDDA